MPYDHKDLVVFSSFAGSFDAQWTFVSSVYYVTSLGPWRASTSPFVLFKDPLQVRDPLR